MKCFISLGSNLGDTKDNLHVALRLLSAKCAVVSESSYYQTEPVDASGDDFLNMVIEIETEFDCEELMGFLLDIETEMGRLRVEKNEPRIIDLDILLCGDLIIDTDHLVIPHPRMHERKFVLIPLVEVDEEVVHPVLKKSSEELLDECKDESKVVKVSF